MVFTSLLLLSFLFPATPSERKVPVYDYAGLEPYLHQKGDTTYVVNFWATWCKPCVKELAYFDELQQAFPDKKIKVLLVSLDFADKKESTLLPFLEKRNIQSEVVVLDDPNETVWIEKIDPSWSGAIPATLIYGPGKRNFYERSFTKEELHQTLIENMK